MKKIFLITVAFLSFTFVSCEKKMWDPSDGIETPVYVSFAKDQVLVDVENGASEQLIFVPIYSEMKNGQQGFNNRLFLVDIVSQGTTAVEGVHYLLNGSSSSNYKTLQLSYLDTSTDVVGRFSILPKNIDRQVTLVLSTKVGAPQSTPETKYAATSRPNIGQVTITLRPQAQ